ncbi:MAG: sulfate ABC transporter permease subunit CysT [Wolinella succinogenes]|uniref:sulfate ABC transporter permease subunit CysT n=1 Tax=Wolinella succinogenes TaxID=844 RepID=UPI00169D6BD9|nr:sulfate ABC transporter permease subunit CysT [Wolinella succinogenes]NLU34277.1 sulfate ABC transporter permease subunit CysT [Wolinella succinogenes]
MSFGSWQFKKPSVLPGFGITLGLSLTYMTLLLLIPIAALFLYTAKLSWGEFWAIASDERVLASFKVSFGSSFLAALINAFFGFIIAWSLVRYQFFGKKIVDALVDLPFALPTAVAGISLAAIFAPQGILGKFLSPPGIELAFSRAGIVIALIFIGLPFVVRTLQPVLEELDRELEEAASSLGASFFQTFRRVIFPSIFPALLTGAALSFARGLGEYGSIIFISSNMPYVSEIVPLLIVTKLMQFDYLGASAIGVLMLLSAFALLLLVNALQAWNRQRRSGAIS